MNRKYEFTGETKLFNGVELKRIIAKIDFRNVKAGDIGGWIENEKNLSDKYNSWISGNARVSGNAQVFGNAWVAGTTDIVCISPIGSRNDTTTFFRNNQSEISVICGCFKGTLEEFLRRVQETHGNSKHAQVYQKAAKLAKLQILGEEKFNKNFFLEKNISKQSQR